MTSLLSKNDSQEKNMFKRICVYRINESECSTKFEYFSNVSSKNLQLSSGFHYFFTESLKHYIEVNKTNGGTFEISSESFNTVPIIFNDLEWKIRIYNSTVFLNNAFHPSVEAFLFNSTFQCENKSICLKEITLDFLSAQKNTKPLISKIQIVLNWDSKYQSQNISISDYDIYAVRDCSFIEVPDNVTFMQTPFGVVISDKDKDFYFKGIIQANLELQNKKNFINLFSPCSTMVGLSMENSTVYLRGNSSYESYIGVNKFDKNSKIILDNNSYLGEFCIYTNYVLIKCENISIVYFENENEENLELNIDNSNKTIINIESYIRSNPVSIKSKFESEVYIKDIQPDTININGALVHIFDYHKKVSLHLQKVMFHDYLMIIDKSSSFIFEEVYGSLIIYIEDIDYKREYTAFKATKFYGKVILQNKLPYGCTMISGLKDGSFIISFHFEDLEWGICLSKSSDSCVMGFKWYNDKDVFLEEFYREWKYNRVAIHSFLGTKIEISLKGIEFIWLEKGSFVISDINAKNLSLKDVSISSKNHLEINCDCLEVENIMIDDSITFSKVGNLNVYSIRNLDVYNNRNRFIQSNYREIEIKFTKKISVFNSKCSLYVESKLTSDVKLQFYNCDVSFKLNKPDISIDVDAFDSIFRVKYPTKMRKKWKLGETKNLTYHEFPTNVQVFAEDNQNGIEYPNGIDYLNEQVYFKGKTVLKDHIKLYTDSECLSNILFQNLTTEINLNFYARIKEELRLTGYHQNIYLSGADFVEYKRPLIVIEEYSFMDPLLIYIISYMSFTAPKIVIENITVGDFYKESQTADRYQPFICTDYGSLNDTFIDFPDIGEGVIYTKYDTWIGWNCIMIAWYNTSSEENITPEHDIWIAFPIISTIAMIIVIAIVIAFLILADKNVQEEENNSSDSGFYSE